MTGTERYLIGVITALAGEMGFTRPRQLAVASEITGRCITNLSQLDKAEMHQVIWALRCRRAVP